MALSCHDSSIHVRWCPPLSSSIVTQLVTWALKHLIRRDLRPRLPSAPVSVTCRNAALRCVVISSQPSQRSCKSATERPGFEPAATATDIKGFQADVRRFKKSCSQELGCNSSVVSGHIGRADSPGYLGSAALTGGHGARGHIACAPLLQMHYQLGNERSQRSSQPCRRLAGACPFMPLMC
jgi:hypothetical protein